MTSKDDGERTDCGGCGESWNATESDAKDPHKYCSAECEDDDTGEEPGPDLCDLCHSSGVNVERTTFCGKTIGIECGCNESAKDGKCNQPDCETCAAGFAEDKEGD